MDDPLLVQIVDSNASLKEIDKSLLLLELLLLLDIFIERTIWSILQREVDIFLVFEGVVKLDYMRMIQTSLDFDLIFQLRDTAMAKHFLFVNDLDGYLHV